MQNKHKTYFNWSTGKDSALALYHLLKSKEHSVEHLLTSVNSHYQRVSMHGLRTELLQQQLHATGIAGSTIELPEQPSNVQYETLMRETVSRLKEDGFTHAAFGDIFLEDLKAYREQQLHPFGITTVFPLWKKDTRQLIHEFIDLGFKAIVICINADALPKTFAGRIIDRSFIQDLPASVDVCGENGEFHTFCFDGPIFKRPIKFSTGEIVFKEYSTASSKHGFWFCDLLPEKENVQL